MEVGQPELSWTLGGVDLSDVFYLFLDIYEITHGNACHGAWLGSFPLLRDYLVEVQPWTTIWGVGPRKGSI